MRLLVAALLACSAARADCLEAPLYSMDGPTCADEYAQCRCSECMTWDAAAGASTYEVRRCTVSTGSCSTQGITVNPLWCFALDLSFPHETTAYRYSVRACNSVGCSAYSAQVGYRGAPYACFDAGREIACYVGDSVVTR